MHEVEPSPIIDQAVEIWQRQTTNLMDGVIKVKLVHGRGKSVFLPDMLFVQLGTDWHWMQPQFFSPVLFAFDGADAFANLVLDLSPRLQLKVGFRKAHLLMRLDDQSFLYRCRVDVPAGTVREHSSPCRKRADGGFDLRLFHHTNNAALAAIRDSGHLLGSSWNLQGSKRLANIEYVYFTDLPAILSEADLISIAMTDKARIFLRPDHSNDLADAVEVKVYRATTADRQATLSLFVPCEMLASQHTWLHDDRPRAAFYEIVGPRIFRVGVKPGVVAPFVDGSLLRTGNEKRFDYAVVGDARTHAGLLAPFDEEHTQEILHVDSVPTGQDIFDVWIANANRPLYHPEGVEQAKFQTNGPAQQ